MSRDGLLVIFSCSNFIFLRNKQVQKKKHKRDKEEQEAQKREGNNEKNQEPVNRSWIKRIFREFQFSGGVGRNGLIQSL